MIARPSNPYRQHLRSWILSGHHGQQATIFHTGWSLDKIIGATIAENVCHDPQCDLIISDKLDGISCLYVRRGGASLSHQRKRKWAKHHTWLIHPEPSLDLLANQDIIVRGSSSFSRRTSKRLLFSDDFANAEPRCRIRQQQCSQAESRRTDYICRWYEIPRHTPVKMKLSEQLRLAWRLHQSLTLSSERRSSHTFNPDYIWGS
jgi:hypothetical protein